MTWIDDVAYRTFHDVRDYGALGDGVIDDTTAIQAAIDAAGTGIVFFPAGTYLVTSTLTVSTQGAQLIGIGSTAGFVRFTVDHSSGPGLLITKGQVVLKDFEVVGSAARKAGAAGSNYGIQLEGPDEEPASLTRQYWRGISSRDHPNHGFVIVGTVNHSMFDQLDARDNGGHGLIIDDGTTTSRSNVQQPGLCSFRHLTSTGNGGHGLAIGHPSQAFAQIPLRVRVVGYDGGPNSTDAGVRFTTDDAYVFGTNVDITMSASAGAGYGFRLMGRNVRLINSRIVGALTRGVTVASHATADTRGVVIENLRMVTDTSLDPAIVVDSGSIRTRICVPVLFNVTTLVTDSGTETSVCSPADVTVTTTSYTATVAEYILVDDDSAGSAVTITLPAAADHTDRVYSIKKLGTTAEVIIDGNASETIDGATTLTVWNQYDAPRLYCDGSVWHIV